MSTDRAAEGARVKGLLLDIGGVLLRNAAQLVPTLADRDPRFAAELDRIGGVATAKDELWQSMLREEITERDYWARRSSTLGAAVGEQWDTPAMIDVLYDAPPEVWLDADAYALMVDTKSAGLPLAALTNDLAAFHGGDWASEQTVFGTFDSIVDGSVTGILKPDARAYAYGIEAMRLPAGDIVFIDDMPWNVRAGSAAGLRAIQLEYDAPVRAFDTARTMLGLDPRPTT